MNYVEKSYEEIFEDALQDSLNQGLISHADNFEDFIANRQDISNYYVMDKSVISYMIKRVYEDITIVHDSKIVLLATGEDLDDIGDEVGIPRPLETKSSVDVIFTVEETDTDINIEEGLVISTEDGIQYETIEPIYIPANTVNATVQCMSIDTGVETRVNSNSLTVF